MQRQIMVRITKEWLAGMLKAVDDLKIDSFEATVAPGRTQGNVPVYALSVKFIENNILPADTIVEDDKIQLDGTFDGAASDDNSDTEETTKAASAMLDAPGTVSEPELPKHAPAPPKKAQSSEPPKPIKKKEEKA